MSDKDKNTEKQVCACMQPQKPRHTIPARERERARARARARAREGAHTRTRARERGRAHVHAPYLRNATSVCNRVLTTSMGTVPPCEAAQHKPPALHTPSVSHLKLVGQTQPSHTSRLFFCPTSLHAFSRAGEARLSGASEKRAQPASMCVGRCTHKKYFQATSTPGTNMASVAAARWIGSTCGEGHVCV